MLEQKYDYLYFQQNYPYVHNDMFNKYYKQQENKFRYFISVNKNINSHVDYTIYRSNGTLENILLELKTMDFQVAKIVDYKSKFPEPREYIYNKFEGNEFIVDEYSLRNILTGRRNRTNDTWYYKIWNDKKYNTSCLMDDDLIKVCYKNIEVRKYKDEDIKVTQFTLCPSVELEYTRDVMDKLKSVIKRIQQDNVNGFYDDVIERITNDFGLY